MKTFGASKEFLFGDNIEWQIDGELSKIKI